MENKTYTLDRIEDFFGVFLLKGNESERLLIPKSMIKIPLQEGDIVEIQKLDYGYEINILGEETKVMKDKVNTLLEKLKSKN